jgi:hypothetical protein
MQKFSLSEALGRKEVIYDSDKVTQLLASLTKKLQQFAPVAQATPFGSDIPFKNPFPRLRNAMTRPIAAPVVVPGSGTVTPPVDDDQLKEMWEQSPDDIDGEPMYDRDWLLRECQRHNSTEIDSTQLCIDIFTILRKPDSGKFNLRKMKQFKMRWSICWAMSIWTLFLCS